MASISLTAGDYDVSGTMNLTGNGATVSNAPDPQIAISINSATTTTDHVDGSNQLYVTSPGASTSERAAVIPSYRISASGSVTAYFKLKLGYTIATPQYTCRISARRRR